MKTITNKYIAGSMLAQYLKICGFKVTYANVTEKNLVIQAVNEAKGTRIDERIKLKDLFDQVNTDKVQDALEKDKIARRQGYLDKSEGLKGNNNA